jgi:hypothetical protein
LNVADRDRQCHGSADKPRIADINHKLLHKKLHLEDHESNEKGLPISERAENFSRRTFGSGEVVSEFIGIE